MSTGPLDGRLPNADWDVVRSWDEAYYAHVFVTADEYEHRAISHAGLTRTVAIRAP